MDEKDNESKVASDNPTNPKKIRHNIFIVVIMLIIVLIVILSQNDVEAIWHLLQKANYSYIGLGILAMIGYWLFVDLSLHLIIRKKTLKQVSTIDSLAIANSAFFFNGITPFSSGGQPFQIYSYHKCGLKSATVTGVLMMNFIIYQIAINIVSFIALGLYFGELSKNVAGFNILVLIGLSINLLILLGLILMAISKKFRSLCNYLVDLVCKIKFLRNKKDAIKDKINTFVCDFQISFKSLLKSMGLLIITLCLQVVSLALYFSIPYFVFRALGVNVSIGELLKIMSLSAFAMTFMIWIPTPGSSGGAEWAFSELFPAMIVGVTGAITASATLLWRFLTYYLSMLFGFISFIIFERRHRFKEAVVEEEE